MNDDTMAENRAIVKDGVRKDGDVVADPAESSDHRAAMNTAARADGRSFANSGEGINASIRTDLR